MKRKNFQPNYGAQQSKKSAKVTWEICNADEMALTISYDLYTQDKSLNEFINRHRKYYDKDARLNIFSLQTFNTIDKNLTDMIKKVNKATIIERPPILSLKIMEDFPLAFKFVLLNPANKDVLKLKINYENDDLSKKLIDMLPKELESKLYDFQKKGVEFGLKNHGRVLIGDEMGVGKTVQALCLVTCYSSDWPVLVLTPATLKYTWFQEIAKWLGAKLGNMVTKQEVQVLKGSNDSIYKTSKFVIVSYDTAMRIGADLEKIKFRIAICDEAHYQKNPDAQRSINLVPVLKKCKRVIIMSGTPAFAKPRELFNQVSIVRPDIFVEFKEFGKRFCDPKISNFCKAIDYDGSSCTKELHFLLKKNIMIRRLKSEVLSELPPKTRIKIPIELSEKCKKHLDAEIAKVTQKLGNSSDVNQFLESEDSAKLFEDFISGRQGNFQSQKDDKKSSVFNSLMKLYGETGVGKVEGTIKFLQDFMENDVKFLLFAHHIEVLDRLEDYVRDKAKKKYMRIDGKVKPEQRQIQVNQFQSDDNMKVAILSLTAASQGITLTKASTVVFVEMHWTPAIMLQAEDRCHRVSQKNNVTCYYLYAEQGLDSKLYENIEKKASKVSSFLDGKARGQNIITEKKDKEKNSTINFDDLEKFDLDDDLMAEIEAAVAIEEQKSNPQQNNFDNKNNDFDNKTKNSDIQPRKSNQSNNSVINKFNYGRLSDNTLPRSCNKNLQPNIISPDLFDPGNIITTNLHDAEETKNLHEIEVHAEGYDYEKAYMEMGKKNDEYLNQVEDDLWNFNDFEEGGLANIPDDILNDKSKSKKKSQESLGQLKNHNSNSQSNKNSINFNKKKLDNNSSENKVKNLKREFPSINLDEQEFFLDEDELNAINEQSQQFKAKKIRKCDKNFE